MDIFPLKNSHFKRKLSSFLQLRMVNRLNLKAGVSHEMRLKARAEKEGDSSCFTYFNPWSRKQLDWSLNHFKEALYSLMDFTKDSTRRSNKG